MHIDELPNSHSSYRICASEKIEINIINNSYQAIITLNTSF